MRIVLAAFLVLVGAVTGSMGVSRLLDLGTIYRPSDLFLTETPETFRAWLKEALVRPDQGQEGTPTDLPPRIADRLLTMGIEKRRAIVTAMMRRSWWDAISTEGRPRRQAREGVRDGVLLALQQAPAAGDLYLLAAALETTLQGYTAQTGELLRSSSSFAPRELPVVLERLRFAPLVWPLLGDGDRARYAADFAVYARAEPDRAAKLRDELAAAGVSLQ